MKKKAVHVNKGGAGKTTTTVLGSYESAVNHKQDTVVIDFDISQGDATYWMHKGEIKKELGDYLFGDAPLADCLIEIREHLYLLPCRSTNSRTKKWARTEGRSAIGERRINELFTELEELGFKECWIDLAPGLLENQALMLTYSDEVINVFEPEAFGLKGLRSWREEIESEVGEARRLRKLPTLVNRLIVLNKINEGYSTHKDVRQEFLKEGVHIAELNQDRKIPDCKFTGVFPQELKDTKKQTINQLKQIGEFLCQ